MAVDADDILQTMLGAAEGAFKDGWSAVRDYAPVEFRKMAIQIESIAENVARHAVDRHQGYSAKTGKILLRMQRNACESVLVALTQLTLGAVQKAMDAIFRVLRDAFRTALGGIL